MDSYIIRIYSRDKKDPKKVTGVVEVVGKEGQKGFIDPATLWTILTGPWGKAGHRRRSSISGRKNHAMTLAEIMRQLEERKK